MKCKRVEVVTAKAADMRSGFHCKMRGSGERLTAGFSGVDWTMGEGGNEVQDERDDPTENIDDEREREETDIMALVWQ